MALVGGIPGILAAGSGSLCGMSPFSRHMSSLPLSHIRLTDPFWSRWQRTMVQNGLLAQYDQLVKTDRLKNFERVAAGETGGFEGYRFNDSDVYKWLEACAYSFGNGSLEPSADLKTKVDHTIGVVACAQMPDGYLNTFFQLMHPELRWRNLSMMHEMYCGGHLIEGGVAFFDATGDRRLLDVAIKFADHVDSRFGPGKRRSYCGHEEIELALLKLAKATGERKYRDLALWMVEERGKRPSPYLDEMIDEESIKLAPYMEKMLCKDGEYVGEYLQDHAPIREHTEVVGHAVRAMYLYIAAAELAMDMDDAALSDALTRTWRNLTHRRMYVTGGIGPSGDNEGFTFDYDLPNLSAYAETCASIGLVFWAHKMLEATGESEYADTMERALYNGALAGISLDTSRFFYDNPLESRGRHARSPWFGCACCPPNIARLIGNVGHYAVGVKDRCLLIHIPVGFEATMELGGVKTKVRAVSDYPWSGDFTLYIDPERPVDGEVRFRIPDWADDVETDIPGLEREAEFESGYIVVRKRWEPGDIAKFKIEMKPRWVAANPRVKDDLGRVCLAFGPLVYAAEEHDLGFEPQLFAADLDIDVAVESATMLEGIQALAVSGVRDGLEFADQLYAEVDDVQIQEAAAKFIPYYAWNNRGANHMQVWIRRL